MRLGGDLLRLFFEDDGDEDGAVHVEPIGAEDMHAGGQTYAQTQGTFFSEAALLGHSTFELPGMPLHSSPQFGTDALSDTSAPAYAGFQNFAMGGLLGPKYERLPLDRHLLQVLVCRRCHLQTCLHYERLLVASMRLSLLLTRKL